MNCIFLSACLVLFRAFRVFFLGLLSIALLSVAGCTALNPVWFPVATPAGSEATRSETAAQSSAMGEPRTAPSPSRPAKLDSRAAAEYLREVAKGVELEQSRQYPEARKHYEQLIHQWPARYEAYHRLGQVCDRQKRFAEAQESYQQAILLAENREPDLFNDLGYSFFLQARLDKAEIAMRKAVALRPAEPKYHNNLGLICGHQRRFQEAWNEFRRAGGEAEAWYNLAFVKSSLNDFEGAKACFRRALAIDPSHERARRALRAFELAETDPDSLAQLETFNDDGTQWVPYVENGQDQDPSPAATAGRDAGGGSGTAGASPNPSITSRNARMAR
jgi:tetratricopeptide (TPR) repeat protein